MEAAEDYKIIRREPPIPRVLVNPSGSLFFDIDKFEHAQRVAKVLATSTLVPEHFRNNLGNCVIALNYADRIKADPFMVLQNMYVVHGKPGIEAKLVIALVNQSGRFEPLEFKESKDVCVAYAKEIKSGKVLEGPTITTEMVKAEGWLDKPGSKWKTMPQIMFRYRAATFFARTYCPEVLLGMQTKEELEDVIVDLSKQGNGSFAAPEKDPKDLKTKVTEKLESLKTEKQIEPESQSQEENAATTPPEAQEAKEQWACGICGFVATSERGLKKHQTQSHTKPAEPEKPAPPPSIVEGFEEQPATAENPFADKAINLLGELSPEARVGVLKLYGLKDTQDLRAQLDQMHLGYREAFLDRCSKQLDIQNTK